MQTRFALYRIKEKLFSTMKKEGENRMNNTIYKTFDELPMYLNVGTVSRLLGMSQSSIYDLTHEDGFPAIKIGSRILIPRDKLKEWLDAKMAC